MAEASPRPIKVLIIDDEPDIVEALCLRFSKAGSFCVETAFSGPSGLAKVKTFKPDVVLLDLVMPETDGWEVCKLLRADPATENLPVVMMTAQDGAATKERAREARIHRVLVKPLDLGALVETLRNALPR
ncbi:MAG: response regulator [Elusimicrobia bacterium]|nr:response regulator [Elusimicrobiota bacterium]